MVRPKNRAAGPPDYVAVGIVRKAHGVRGEASVEPWTDSVERFYDLTEVLLVSPDGETLPTRIESVRPHAGRVLTKFEGIESPEALRRFHEWTVEIPPSAVRKLSADEYFLHDLEGLVMIDARRGRVGVVESADEGGGGVLLSVRRDDGSHFDVPFAAAICTRIDIAGKTIEVDLPEGLDDLDEAVSAGPEDEPDLPAAAERREDQTTEPEPREAALRIDLVTIFPRMFDGLLQEGIVARGVRSGILDIRVWDLRSFATDKHKSTDDEAYGGGAGMVMLAEPVFRCIEELRRNRDDAPWVVMMSPQGRTLNQSVAAELPPRGWIVILCGRYEGFDDRVRQALVSEEISIGDYVVAGGEIPAMLLIEAVSRLVPGVVGDQDSVVADSFYSGLLDYPHYTRPAELRGMKVPEILLSGHFEKIRKWRKEQSIRATLARRPDLLATAGLDREGEKMLEAIRREMAEAEENGTD